MANGAGRVGIDKFATGAIVGPGSATVRVDGVPMSVVGDRIAPHGESPHKLASVVTGSATVRVDGKPASVQGISTASCGHPETTGSSTVRIGS